jgi:hypothetical protein
MTSATAAFIEKTIRLEDRPLIAEWINEQNRLSADDKSPFIANEDLPSILARHKYTFAERVDKFLAFLLEKTAGQPGQAIDRFEYKIHATLQTFDDSYIAHIVQYLTQEGFLGQSAPTVGRSGTRGRHLVQLTPRGVMRAEGLVRIHTASMQGFVAMWFDKSMDEAWSKGFYPGVSNAGYTPRRIDKTEHVNKICDEIIAEIRKSRFLIADFTGQRGGVYYESGYASGRDIPVIWTCRQDDIGSLHFDIRQLQLHRLVVAR